MARSKYIYLILPKRGSLLPLSAHTVKYEAHVWVRLHKTLKFADVELYRMRDNAGETDAKLIDWELKEGDE